MPDIVLQLLAAKQGLDLHKDFRVRYVPTPMEAMQLLITRRVSHALLAEPAVSLALRKTKSFPIGLIAPELPERFDCHGQRAIGRGSLHFENVRVPADHLLGACARRTPGRRFLKMLAVAAVLVGAGPWTRAQRGRRHG